MSYKLAINGGSPIASYSEWPKWPLNHPSLETALTQVLKSHRWTVSGFYTGAETFDEKFCENFASYHNTRYALTVDHGSSAILLALQALGVSFGDEVIVPGITWVACASTILRANATPVFVDVEERTFCLDPTAVEKAITPRTRAILVVHLYCCMADMDSLRKISNKYNIPLIEDCSQAHGSMWKDQKAGSIGHIGVFSMQQGKPLTCGEGGAIITNDNYLYSRMVRLKNDGRALIKNPPLGHQTLIEQKGIIGSNLALSEFQCAILYESLKHLDGILTTQRENAQMLMQQLSKIKGLKFLTPHPKNVLSTYYHVVVICDSRHFQNISIPTLAKALTQELGFWIYPIYKPVYKSMLFEVDKEPRIQHLKIPSYCQLHLPVCEKASLRALALHHSVLLSPPSLLGKIVEAFLKIKNNIKELDRIEHPTSTFPSC